MCLSLYVRGITADTHLLFGIFSLEIHRKVALIRVRGAYWFPSVCVLPSERVMRRDPSSVNAISVCPCSPCRSGSCGHRRRRTSAQRTWEPPCGALLHRPELSLIRVTLQTLQYLNILCIVYRIWPVLFLAEKIDGTEVFSTR